jgi:hypothetical protein
MDHIRNEFGKTGMMIPRPITSMSMVMKIKARAFLGDLFIRGAR